MEFPFKVVSFNIFQITHFYDNNNQLYVVHKHRTI
jgi:hypothetical protein